MTNHYARAFCFTINNDTVDDLLMLLNAECRYLCFGFETGKQGTRHIQGYIYFDIARTISSLKKKIMPRAHIEISKGTAKENAVYTSKDNDWYEFGERPTQGRAKWDLIEDVMKDPLVNPEIYNRFNKMYRQVTLSKKKEHVRRLFIIPHDKLFYFAKKFETVCMDSTFDTYDGENAAFFDCYADNSNFVIKWVNGFPPKIKRGYELICVDPEFVFITYEDSVEKNYLLKKYLEHIEYEDYDAFLEAQKSDEETS